VQHVNTANVIEEDSVPEAVCHEDNERIFLLRFNRRPKGMHEQLATSASLKPCREDLETACYS